MDRVARIFLTSYAATGNQTHVSSVAPLLRDLNPGRFTDSATAAAATNYWHALSFGLVPVSDT